MTTLADPYTSLVAGLPAVYTTDVLSGLSDLDLTENARVVAELEPLLCVHHLWAHNLGWRITHEDGDYSFIPPTSIDPEQTPIPARPGNPIITRLTNPGRASA